MNEWMNKKETKIALCQQGKRGVLVHPKNIVTEHFMTFP